MPVTLFIGLDVHNDSIAISLAPSDSTEVRRWGIIGGTHAHLQRFIGQLQKGHPDATLQFCYEAGPRGYPLCRFLRGLGQECIIVCPSRVPRRPGNRVKTDRRDADQLARLYRAGELTGLHVPQPEDEAMRDLLRSRFQVGRAQHRARQQLKMFLLRHNFRYTGKSAWTPAHLRYLARIKMPFPAEQFALQELMNAISEAGERLERFDAQIAREVAGWRWEPAVRALMSLRGVALLNAATLVAELGDLKSFHPARRVDELSGSDAERTVMDAFIATRAQRRESTRDRYDQAFREPVLARFASRRLLETQPADILQLIKNGTVSTNMYFRRLHSFALTLGWLGRV